MGGDIERRAGDRQRQHADHRSRGVEGVHDAAEAVADLADEVIVGYDDVVEHELRRLAAADAHLVLDALKMPGRAVRFHHEPGDALRSILGAAGAGEHAIEVGHAPVGDVQLGAVQHPSPVDLRGPCRQRGTVGACALLGEADADQRARFGHALQPTILVVARAGSAEDVGEHDARADRQRSRRKAVGQLFDDEALRDDVGADAAVLRRDRETEQAELVERVDRLLREGVGAIDLGDHRLQDSRPTRRATSRIAC